MSKQRGHKQHEMKDTVDMVDYISNLPDCILHHILSYVPTKEVVKTSALSTRWKNLWDSVPNLDVDATELDDWRSHIVTSFLNFVERVLRLRSASNIKKFRLTCCDSGSYEEYRVHSWISDAINHNVQELELGNYGGLPTMFPWSILDTTSLVSLKISTSFVRELPSCISFPCLKTLHLLSALFQNDAQAQKLLLGCPVLEELVLSDIWMDLNNIVISSSTLKSLTIHDMLTFGAYDDPTHGCKIKIDATNLTYFEYDGFLSNEITLNNVSTSLVEACINIVRHPRWKKVACRAVNLLKGLQHVVSLSVSNPAIESLMFVDNMWACFPKFENLSHLTLTKEIRNETFGALMDFLYLCPSLKSLCLSEGLEHHMRLVENDPIWLSYRATCVSNCLKTVILKKFHGYQSEICFIKCVLKYACVLERMNVWWSETKKLKDVKKTEVEIKLETIERISTACVIKFF